MHFSEIPDHELVELALRGDKKAFGELVERHQESIRKIALRMVADDEIVRELVQESLLEAYLSLERLRQPEKFRSWLCGIVLNLCRSHLREQKRQARRGASEREEQDFAWWKLQSGLPGPEQVAEAREQHRLVLGAIEELPSDQREATLLFYFEFLSLREIAAVAGISLGAVKVRLHRARNQLRESLLQKYPEIQPVTPAQERRKKMIRVSIADVIRPNGKTVLLLLDESEQRVLPIWIGEFEGMQIVMGVRGFDTLRPMTFNFIANLLEALDAELEEARVEALKEETFYGVAKLRIGGATKEVDARPSDVLALAAKTGSPIYVAEKVMEQAGKMIKVGIGMPHDLQGVAEMPLPTGEGMDLILKEVEAIIGGGKREGCRGEESG